jgi:hypothetical protein
MIEAQNDNGHQGPDSGRQATEYAELLGIMTHPAFRIGFLDARGDKPLDHDRIIDRLYAETPHRAFERMGYGPMDFKDPHEVEMAQLRYEEGRRWWVEDRPTVRGWNHPDFPPRAVYQYLNERCKAELAARAEEYRRKFDGVSIVDAMRARTSIVPRQREEELPMFGVRQ